MKPLQPELPDAPSRPELAPEMTSLAAYLGTGSLMDAARVLARERMTPSEHVSAAEATDDVRRNE